MPGGARLLCQDLAAVLRVKGPGDEFEYRPRAPTQGEEWNYLMVVGYCYAVRATQHTFAHQFRCTPD